MRSLANRTAEILRTEGLGGIARRLRRLVEHTLLCREAHIWYELDLAPGWPVRPLGDGLELVKARDDGELELLRQLPTSGPDLARQRLGRGADLWIVRDGERAAFSCWIYHGQMPVYAASGGWCPLPPGTVNLEESVTAEGYRGRGIAPCAWEAIAASLRAEKVRTMITKVAVDNAPSRTAVSKAGFREVALMRLVKAGPWRFVTLSPLGPSTVAFLANQLAGIH